MASESSQSRWLQLLVAIIFSGLSLGSMIFFLGGAGTLINDLLGAAPIITFDTSVYRFLGVAIGTAGLAGAAVIVWAYQEKPPKAANKWIGRCLIAGLLLMFLLPHITHFPLERYLFNNGYKICEPRSYATRSYRSIAYANSVPACLEGVERKSKGRR